MTMMVVIKVVIRMIITIDMPDINVILGLISVILGITHLIIIFH